MNNAIALSIDRLPLISISAEVIVTAITSDAVVPFVFPSIVNVSSTINQQRSWSLAISAQKSGEFDLAVILNGASAAEYTVVYATSTVIVVTAINVPPPVPVLLSGAFSNDGSFVRLMFDSPTDKAGYSNSFPCSALLSFAGNQKASCRWTSDSQIVVSPLFNPTFPSDILSVNSSILLYENVLRAACRERKLSCDGWATMPSTVLTVMQPVAPVSPTVVIQMARNLGACSVLSVSISNSVSATGRPWKSVTFRVWTERGATLGALRLERYLMNNFTLSTPTVVPFEVFPKDYSYTIQVELCNFLGACGIGTRTVNVSSSEALVPVVSITGQTERFIKRSSPLTLTSSTYTQSCSGTVSYSNLEYAWSIQQLSANGLLADVAIGSASQDPTTYKLLAGSLAVNSQYIITLTVISTVSSLYSTAEVKVTVAQGNLIAKVSGGAMRSMMVGEMLTLDASNSYDTDYPFAGSVALLFSWSCVQIQPVFLSTCPLGMSGTTTKQLSLTAAYQALNTTAQLTLTVADATRASSAVVEVKVSVVHLPQLDIVAGGGLGSNPFNVDKKLSLYGTVRTLIPCIAQWTSSDVTLSLLSAASTPTRQEIVLLSGTAVPFNLQLKPNTLPTRASVQFSLTCGGGATFITITTNGPPLPGVFSVHPSLGIELTTSFQFSASLWSDEDLPLTYAFGFESATALSNLVIVRRSERTFSSSVLPAGTESDNYVISCSLQVTDSIGAAADARSFATVTPLLAANKLAALSNMLQNTEGDSVDSIRNTLTVVSTALNAANCTGAPTCSTLNRSACQRTTDTCGSCMSGYVGDSGDRNTRCMPAQTHNGTRASLASVPCWSSDQCAAWEQCELKSGICQILPKTCGRNCSDRGECIYVSLLDAKPLSLCRLNDLDCDAVCACMSPYSGQFCEIDVDSLRDRREVRSTLLEKLANLTTIDDINEESVTAWSANLYSLCLNPYELAVDDMETISMIANDTLVHALGVGEDVNAALMVGVLQATDVVASLMTYNYNPIAASGNRTYQLQQNTAARMLPVVSSFGDLVVSTMILGNNPVSLYYDNFKLTVGINSVSMGSSNKTLSSPLSTNEVLAGILPTTVTLSTTVSGDQTIYATKAITVFPRAYSSDTAGYVSNPLTLQIQSVNNFNAVNMVSEMEFTFQHNIPQPKYAHPASAISFTTICTKQSAQQNLTCPGSGLILQQNCSQGPGIYVSHCPVLAPACGRLRISDATVTIPQSCKVTAYNVTHTTCLCTLKLSDQRKKRLNTAEQDLLDQTGTADMMATTTYVAADFADTFTVADEFTTIDDVQQTLPVLVMMATLWLPGLLVIIVNQVKLMSSSNSKNSMNSKKSAETSATENILAYVDAVIPKVFCSRTTLAARLTNELFEHHMLLKLFKSMDPKKRRNIMLQTITTFMFMLFLVAVFFDVSNPGDDGTCADFTTEEKCLQRTSPFDYDQTYCTWSSGMVTDSCIYNESTLSNTAMFYLTVFTTIISSIGTIPVNFLFGILAAPTAQNSKSTQVDAAAKVAISQVRRLSQVSIAPVQPINQQSKSKLVSFGITTEDGAPLVTVHRELPDAVNDVAKAARRSIHILKRNNMIREKQIRVISQRMKSRSTRLSFKPPSMEHPQPTTVYDEEVRTGEPAHIIEKAQPLLTDILLQRMCLKDSAPETKEYEDQWGIVEKGGQHKITTRARAAICEAVDNSTVESKRLAAALANYSIQHVGLEILHLFILDLLGKDTAAAKVFKEKFGEEFEHSRVIHQYHKVGAFLALLSLNAFFFYYVLLKAFQKGNAWQLQYVVCCIAQILCEILLFQTVECAWIHFWVPYFVRDDVSWAALTLRKLVVEVARPAAERVAPNQTGYFLEAPPALFVSLKLAKLYPDLLESTIIEGYHSHLPGKISSTWPHVKERKSECGAGVSEWGRWLSSLLAGVAVVVHIAVTAPYAYQRIAITFGQPIVFAAVSIVWFQTFRHPASLAVMSFLTAAGIGYIAWGQYTVYRDSKRPNAAKVVPENVEQADILHCVADSVQTHLFVELEKEEDSDDCACSDDSGSLHLPFWAKEVDEVATISDGSSDDSIGDIDEWSSDSYDEVYEGLSASNSVSSPSEETNCYKSECSGTHMYGDRSRTDTDSYEYDNSSADCSFDTLTGEVKGISASNSAGSGYSSAEDPSSCADILSDCSPDFSCSTKD